MKNLLIVVFVLNFSLAFCQNNFKSLKLLPTLSNVNFSNNSFLLNLNFNKSFSTNDLSIYNPITNLNDNYYLLGDKYYMSNTKSFSFFGFDGQRIDSFNPNGTNDFKSALLNGAINSIIKKL